MTALFWVLLLAPIVLFIASFIYYIKVQRHKPNSPYAWQAIGIVTALCWGFAVAVYLWNAGIIA